LAWALTSGYHLAFAISAAMVVTAIAITAVVLQPESAADESIALEPTEA